jgi:hypothetical protein
MPDGLQNRTPFAGHSSSRERPLGSYGLLISSYAVATVAFGTWLRRSGRQVPEQVSTRDLMLMTVATHKLTRIIARDRVTSVLRAPFTRFQDDAGPSEVDEAARGTGVRRALGELIVCPYCLAMWTATGLVAAHIVAPRATRLVTSALSVVAGADVLQIGYAKAESTL